MNKLTKITKRQDIAVVSSRVLAEQLGKRHDNVIRDIEEIIKNSTTKISILLNEYSSNLRATQDLTNSDLRTLKNENICFIKTKYKASNGKMNPEYLITKKGFVLYTFNIQGYNDFKLAYINDFEKMEKIISNKNNPEWLTVEKHSKAVRKIETDTIKNLIEYAKAQGSKNANRLYIVYSSLINRLMGISERDSISPLERLQLAQLENIINRTINNGMKQGKNYKDIYTDCQKIGNESIELIKFNPVLVN